MDALREQPTASSSVAEVCRRSWNRHSGREEEKARLPPKPSLERLGYHRSSLRDLTGTIMVS
jgi:hypothetical protein